MPLYYIFKKLNIMLSKKALEYFKNNNYSFEQINRISESMESIEKWVFISENQMNSFVKNDLFSNYKVNV